MEDKTIEKIKKSGLWWLPSTELDIINTGHLNRTKYLLNTNNTVVVILTYGKVGSKTIRKSLNEIKNSDNNKNLLYHIHSMNEVLSSNAVPNEISGHELRKVFKKSKFNLKWKFIIGIRKLISHAISLYYESHYKQNGPFNFNDTCAKKYLKSF